MLTVCFCNIQAGEGLVVVNGGTISGCKCFVSGGAVAIEDGSSMELHNVHVSNCEAGETTDSSRSGVGAQRSLPKRRPATLESQERLGCRSCCLLACLLVCLLSTTGFRSTHKSTTSSHSSSA